MRQLKVKIKGVSPLLMHWGRLADPLDPATKALKALTGKRGKSDNDHEGIIRCEWEGGLYHNADGPFLPGQNFDTSLKNAAKQQKLGKQFGQGVLVVEDDIPLQYKGPRDRDGLFAGGFRDYRGVKVGQSRLMRSRPKFNEWACSFTVSYDETIVNEAAVRAALDTAGRIIGVGDYRPEKGGRYGKFTAEVE